MFKTSFSKYLTAFIIIILASFLMLSAIITSMLRTHISSDKEDKMEMTCSIIAEYFFRFNKDNIEAIRKELETENLISHFYEAGDIYLTEFSENFDNFSYKSLSNEQMQSDKKAISEYIEKNEGLFR